MRLLWPATLLAVLAGGCSLNRSPIAPALDVGGDARDGAMDADLDAPERDAGMDAGDFDGGDFDGGGFDGGEPDGGELDGGLDGGTDAGSDDAGIDAGRDAGRDGGRDAPCVPGCPDDYVLRTCAGGIEAEEPCALGCYETAPGPHCADMIPANVSSAYASAVLLGAVTVSGAETINTSSCIWDRATDLTGVRVSVDGGGRTVCLMALTSLNVEAAGSIYAYGNVPLVIVAAGDVTISGAVSVDSARSPPWGGPSVIGAGSGTGGTVGGAGMTSGTNDGGGGGGGFGGGGGRGGTGGTGGTAGTASSPTLIPLVGGAAGGSGPGTGGAAGGAGGGALQITALGAFVFRGYIGAGGAGGEGGGGDLTSSGAGGGGGSGGGIVLEGSSMMLAGGVINIAGGGGGGAGCAGFDSGSGDDGGDGVDVPTMRAAAGAADCGDGGSGGAGTGGTSQNGTDGNNGDGGGGGGGGAGQVLFRVPEAALALPGTVTLNPTYGSAALRYTVADVARR